MICFVNYDVIYCESYVVICCVNYVECFVIYDYGYDLAFYGSCSWCDYYVCDVGVCVYDFEVEKSYDFCVCSFSKRDKSFTALAKVSSVLSLFGSLVLRSE